MNNNGAVLLVVLLALIVVASLGAVITMETIMESKVATRMANNTRAFWMAEAGIQRAIWEVRKNDCRGMHVQDSKLMCSSCRECGKGNKVIFRSFPTGEYEATVDKANTMVMSGGYFPAQKGPHMYRVVKVNISGVGTFGYGAFGTDGVSVENGAQTDSYNSVNGEYGVGGNKIKGGDIGTNGTSVNLGANAKVAGDVSTGKDGTVNATGATITGDITHDNQVSMPPVLVPVTLSSLLYPSPEYLTVTGATTLGAGDYKFSRLTVLSGGTLSIDGSVRIYLTDAGSNEGTFSIQDKATFKIGNNGSLKLYTNGKVYISNKALINNSTKDASKLTIYSTYSGSSGVVVGNRSDIYATVYSPQTNLEIQDNTSFYGSVVGRTVAIGSNSQVHYDENLRTLSIGNDIGVSSNWQEL